MTSFPEPDGDGVAEAVRRQAVATVRELSNLLAAEQWAELDLFIDVAARIAVATRTEDPVIFPVDPMSPATKRLLLASAAMLTSGLSDLWAEWMERYDRLVERSPRLRLAIALRSVEEPLGDAEPSAFTLRFAGYVRSGSRAPWEIVRLLGSHFDDDPFPVLRRLADEAGGWVVRDDLAGMLVFVPDPPESPRGEPYV